VEAHSEEAAPDRLGNLATAELKVWVEVGSEAVEADLKAAAEGSEAAVAEGSMAAEVDLEAAEAEAVEGAGGERSENIQTKEHFNGIQTTLSKIHAAVCGSSIGGLGGG